MPAPSNTVWGNIVTGSKSTRQGRVGISVTTSSDALKVYCTVQTWFWSMYSISDSSNTYSYNGGVIGSVSINHTVSSGGGWSTSNQTKLGESTYTFNKTTSAYARSFLASLTGIDNLGSSSVMSASTSITVPALASYTVSYNANGGTGAPSSQTKWYGTALTLSTVKPTRTGYSFQGWAISASGSVSYNAGGTYSANANITLYAVWKANTYKVQYNANGGTGAPSSQTKTYGVTLTLASTKPTRENYNFLGWATSMTATTVTYKAGASYTQNAAVTLYAVWELAYIKPRINNINAIRCISVDETYEPSTDGTYALINFDWDTDQACKEIKIEWKSPSEKDYTNSITESGGSKYAGTFDGVIGGPNTDTKVLSPDSAYTVRITVTDTNGKTITHVIIPGAIYPIDVLIGGHGVAFGKVAELDDTADFGWPIHHGAGFSYPILEAGSDLNDEMYRTPNKYIISSVQKSDYKCGNASIPITSGTGMLTIESFGPEGQVKQTIEVCHKTNPLRYERYYYQSSWGDWYEAGGYKSAVTAEIANSITLGVVNTYTMIPFDDYRYQKKGSGLTVTEDGYIQIGEGIQRIMLSAQLKINCGSTAGNRHARLCINSGGTVSYIAWSHIKMNASEQNAITFPSVMTSVSKGDLIYAVFYTPDATDLVYAGNSNNGSQTYITVESI